MKLKLREYLVELGLTPNSCTPILVVNRLVDTTNLTCPVITLSLQRFLDATLNKKVISQFSVCYLNLNNTNTPINKRRYNTELDLVSDYLIENCYLAIVNNGYLILEHNFPIKLSNLKLSEVKEKVFCKTNRKPSVIVLPTQLKPIEPIAKPISTVTLSKQQLNTHHNKLDKNLHDKAKTNNSKTLSRLKTCYPISLEKKNLYWILREGDELISLNDLSFYKVHKVTYRSDYEPPIVEVIPNVTQQDSS